MGLKAMKSSVDIKTNARAHTAKGPFMRKECGKTFKNLSLLTSHTATHASRKDRCDICSKSNSYPAPPCTHMHTHRRHRPHQCTECPAAFVVKSHLKDHLKVHSDERPFMCEVCGKAFKFASVLESHLTIHTGKEKYRCDECGKLYRYRASLYIHMHTHTGQRPYKCNKCPASFLVKSHLIDHLRIHSGEKPFVCEICLASFSRTIGLQKHLRAHIRRGVEVDLEAVIYRAKLRAKVQPRGSSKDQPESRSPHHTDREESKGTEESMMLYAESLPDDEADVVLTLCSIGDGSICSHSIEKHPADSRLRAQAVMKDRILTAKKLISLGHDHPTLIQLGYSCSSKDYVHGEGDCKHPVPRNKPKSSSKCISAKPAAEGQPSGNKTHKDAENVDSEPSSHVTPRNQNLVQTQPSVNSGRSIYISQTVESGDSSADREKSKPPHTSKSKEVLKGLFNSPHLQDQSFRSGECDTVLPSNDKLKKQKESHSGPHQYTHPKCCQVFQHKEPSAKHHHHLKASISHSERQTHPSETQAGQDDPYLCTLCGKSFTKRFLLKVHYRKHTGEKLFVCQKCNKRFISATHRKIHKRLHTSEHPFQFPYCRKPHMKRGHLQQHLRVCHRELKMEEEGTSNIPLSLTLCVKPENGVLVCNVQEESYQDSECGSLRNSLREHPCQPFGASSGVTEKQDHPYEPEATYDTVLKIEESDFPQKILHHKSTENTREMSEKETNNHQESWLKEGNIKVHADMTTKPSQARPQELLSCRYCPKAFRYKSAVTSHERSHTGEKPFPCPECGKGFSKKSNMETHTRTHTGERPFLCDLCGKHFSHRYTLEAHKWLHTGEKPFQCGICRKSFRHETNRQVHFKRHAGEKNFKCDFCPKAFVTKGDLQDHRRVHTKERPYRCEECGRRFAVRHHLSDHRKIHGGDRPHNCQYCNMSFVRARSWRLHEQKHSQLMRESFQGSV